MHSKKHLALLFYGFVGALTKSTIAFIVPIYFFFRIFRDKKLELSNVLYTALLSTVVMSVALSIRSYYGMERYYLGGLWQYDRNITHLRSLDLMAYTFLLIAIVPVIVVAISWRNQPALVKSVAVCTVPFASGHFLISRIEEFRTIMPLAPLLLLSVVIFQRDYLFRNEDDPLVEVSQKT